MNKVLKDREKVVTAFEVDEDEVDALVAALDYYREVVDPSSGDVLARAEFRCPSCGNCDEFRGQDRQVSVEEKHFNIGVEIIRIHGIAQCSECKMQIKVNQFQPVKLDGFDQDGWKDLYEEEYQGREKVVKFAPEQ